MCKKKENISCEDKYGGGDNKYVVSLIYTGKRNVPVCAPIILNPLPAIYLAPTVKATMVE